MQNVVIKVHDSQKFVATKEYMSRQRSGRLPKRTVEECRDIFCEEGRKSMSRHLIALLRQKTRQMATEHCCDIQNYIATKNARKHRKECRDIKLYCRDKTEGRRLEVCRDNYILGCDNNWREFNTNHEDCRDISKLCHDNTSRDQQCKARK